jgi:3-methyladenine DNA glycosylase AlkD
LLAALRRELKASANQRRATSSLRFFKTGPGDYGEGDRFLGLSVPQLRTLSRAYQDLPLRDLQTLLKSSWHEERALSLMILVQRYARATPERRDAIHRFYMRHLKYVNNWDLVDCSAEYLAGAHLRGPDRAVLVTLATSPRVWDRRVAIIATFHDIKRGEFDWTLRIARLLLDDRHDLIHKAAGWMLREVGKRDRASEERFLREHAARMPRTMLRYAIEKFPEAKRKKYLGRRSLFLPSSRVICREL